MTLYPYIHLRAQSSFSLAEGAIKIKRIAEYQVPEQEMLLVEAIGQKKD